VPKGEPGGGKFGGVVAGVSRAYGFDLKTTRIATAVAMLVLPVLWFVYIAAWILLPPTPAEAVPLDSVLRDRRRMPLILVIALVLVAGGVGSLGSWFLFRGAPWGVVLVGIGVLLWMLSDRRHAPVPPPSAFPPPTTSTGADLSGGTAVSPTAIPNGAAPDLTADITAEHVAVAGPITAEYPVVTADITGQYPAFAATTSTGTTPATTPVVTPPATTSVVTTPTTPRRPRRPIASIGVGIAALWFVIAASLSALGWWHSPSLWVLVSGIGIVLAALLVSTVVNRSWFLPAPFTLLAIVFIALCIAQPRLDGGSGTRQLHPTTVAAAQQAQHLAAGHMELDLSAVPLGRTPVAVTTEIGMGDLLVSVPAGATVEVHADAGLGAIYVEGALTASGVRVHDDRTLSGAGATTSNGTSGTGTIVLDLRVGMGRIEVRRAP
jgi:phage shock protein PspC (stress-responsive transcriptional regulator)